MCHRRYYMMPLLGYPGTRYQVPGTRYQVPGTRYQVAGASSIFAMYRWQYNEPPESWVSGTSDVLEELLFGGSVLYFEVSIAPNTESSLGQHACILVSRQVDAKRVLSRPFFHTHIFLVQVIRCQSDFQTKQNNTDFFCIPSDFSLYLDS